jgi:hypothetical protein
MRFVDRFKSLRAAVGSARSFRGRRRASESSEAACARLQALPGGGPIATANSGLTLPPKPSGNPQGQLVLPFHGALMNGLVCERSDACKHRSTVAHAHCRARSRQTQTDRQTDKRSFAAIAKSFVGPDLAHGSVDCYSLAWFTS